MGLDDDVRRSTPPADTGAGTPPLVILTRRRTSAGEIFRMLQSHVGRPSAGLDPFAPGQPLHVLGRAFQQGRYWDLKRLARQSLASRPFFRYHYDVEPVDLSMQLFGALAQAGYRALVLDRDDEAERIFSLAVCMHFDAWDNDTIDVLRNRLRAGRAIGAPSARAVRELVRAEAARQAWFERVLPGIGIPFERFSYERIYRRGIGVLGEMDRLFAFAGLPSRDACVADDSLLRFTFLRGHYTLGLVQYSRPLMELYEAIRDELGRAGATVVNDES